MRQYKLDLIKPLPPPPVLNGARPSMPRIAEAVGKDDGGRMLTRGREHERGRPGDGGRHGFVGGRG